MCVCPRGPCCVTVVLRNYTSLSQRVEFEDEGGMQKHWYIMSSFEREGVCLKIKVEIVDLSHTLLDNYNMQ